MNPPVVPGVPDSDLLISVVMPVYNEPRTIREIVQRIEDSPVREHQPIRRVEMQIAPCLNWRAQYMQISVLDIACVNMPDGAERCHDLVQRDRIGSP